jgi:hypothetical protein
MSKDEERSGLQCKTSYSDNIEFYPVNHLQPRLEIFWVRVASAYIEDVDRHVS